MTKAFIVIDNGSIKAASIKNPIACMELIEQNKTLSNAFDIADIQSEDLINFESTLKRLEITGVSQVVNIEE